MSNDAFRYDILAQEALRGVVRSVLRRVEKRGLPGDHHFVITFDTTAPGVSISKRLLDRYPQEMTIVIQYQFWGLKVYENAFEIGLSFNNVPETLVIPFRAMKSFQDPSAGFMLQFAGLEPQAEAVDEELQSPGDEVPEHLSSKLPTPAEPALPGPGEQALLSVDDGEAASESVETAAAPAKPEGTGEEDWQDNQSDEKKKGAEVVHLDAFRKK